MKVLIDGKALWDDSSYRGIGTYLRNLISGLANRPDVDLTVMAVRGAPVPEGPARLRVHRPIRGRFTHAAHQVQMKLDLARHASEFDVFHAPALDVPRLTRLPVVQTLFDTTPLVIPAPELGGERERMLRSGPALRAAARIIAISTHTAQDGVRLLGLDPRKITVAPLGVPAGIGPPDTHQFSDPPFVLYVGEYGPHKGFAEAIAVVEGLARLGFPHRLKMVGRIAPHVVPVVRRLRHRSVCPSRVELTGFVPNVLPLYHRASAMIVTSRYEGFGLPALEAMATGLPVVAFHNSATAEVVGSGGLLVPDGDVLAMVSALRTLLDEPQAWLDLSERSLDRASDFRWSDCVDAHVAAYAAAIE